MCIITSPGFSNSRCVVYDCSMPFKKNFGVSEIALFSDFSTRRCLDNFEEACNAVTVAGRSN